MKNLIVAVVLFLVVLGILFAEIAIVFWALNTLFNLEIGMTLTNFVAALILKSVAIWFFKIVKSTK